MKNRVVRLTPKFIVNALLGKTAEFAPNLPSNVELLDIKYDLFSNQVLAVIRSESFQDVAETQPTPEFSLQFTPIAGNQTPPPMASERQSAKREKAECYQTTNRIEGEFSPEQRKLLSFKTEGGQIVVKPTQYLKEEWEDINETVRSLGGRWVKGDILSYWVIPA